MKVKNFLFNRTSTEQLEELSRASMFPLYRKELNIRRIDKQLAKRDYLARTVQDALTRKKEKLTRKQVNHGFLFKTYLKALLKGKIENVSDMQELVESHYLPRITFD